MDIDKVVSYPLLTSNQEHFPSKECLEPDSQTFKICDKSPSEGQLDKVKDPTDLPLLDADRISENSAKAEFYIGDETLIPSPTTENKEPPNFPVSVARVQTSDPAQKDDKKMCASDFVPPDGGYGWVISLSACFVNVFIIGVIKSFGVLYVPIMKKFPGASAYQASWVPVFLSTSGLLIAPATGYLCRRFTSRKVSIFGGFLSSMGILLAAFATSMTQMIFSLGVLTGLGAGLVTTPGILITSLYFEKRRATASAICVSGNAIGSFIFPPLIEYLLLTYGLNGTLLILAALQLNVCVVSLLYRPITVHAGIQKRKELREKKLLESQRSPVHSFEKFSSFYKTESLFKRSFRKRLVSISSSVEDEELQRQVSFYRSSSMMNSIPDLVQYARSWSSEQGSVLNYHPSMKVQRKDGKSSALNLLQNSNVNFEKRKISSLKEPRTRGQPMSLLPEADDNSETSLEEGNAGTNIAPTDSLLNARNNAKDVKYVDQNLNINISEDELKTNSNITVVSKLKSRKLTLKKNLRRCGECFDRDLFSNFNFWLVTITVTLISFGAPHALFFLPAYATSVNINQGAVIYLMSISSIIDLVARLGSGFLADSKLVRSSIIYATAGLSSGCSLILLPLVPTTTGVGVILGIYGFGVGSWFVLVPTLLAEHHGTEKLAASYGFVRMCQGIVNFISPQISGLLIDGTGSYSATYYYMGCAMVMGGLVMYLEPAIFAYKRARLRRALQEI